ncbi:MAG: hypothetical protein KatS3mg094_546 [Candidatus Parcubacteria bacterium]|nr:MAG: hypothetical protein KatS3mg094_546 [Candidatus Parcubacteria bacterium]
MIIERFRQEKERQQREVYKQSPEGASPTFKEILDHPVYSDMLNALLENDGQNYLREKLVKREELTQDDFEKLYQYRIKIKEALDRSKEVLDILNSPERIELMASCSPEFAKIVGVLGAEETLDLLKRYMALIYVKNPESFNDLSSKIETITQAEQQLQSLEQQIRDFAEAHKIPSNIIERFYQLSAQNRTVAEQSLITDIRKNLSFIGKIRDFINRGEFSYEYFKSLNKIDEIEEQLNTINQNLGEIGNMIAEAIESSGTDLLSKYLYGRRIEIPSFSFKNAGELIEIYGSDEELEREWQEYLEDQEVTDWEQIDDEERATIKNGFKKHLSRKNQEKFGKLFDWFFGNNGPLGRFVNSFLNSK